jgi:ferrous iron transport protein B
MVFFALCMQCGATVAIIKAEANWKWAASAFALMTTMAWIGAVLTYQLLSHWMTP